MPAWNLTPREREVAALIIEGRSSDDIAASLFLSPHTVRDHTKAIFGKVGVHNRRHLTAPSPANPAKQRDTKSKRSQGKLPICWRRPDARQRPKATTPEPNSTT